MFFGHTGFHHPMERTCSVPGYLTLGQAWKLSEVGGGACNVFLCEVGHPPLPPILWYFTQHPCSRTPSGTRRCGCPILALTIHKKEGTERVHDLPRVTQHISGKDRSPH